MGNISPLAAIRFKCLDCCCGSVKEVVLCEITDCSLHPFRMGKNPNRTGKGKAANFKRRDVKSGVAYQDQLPVALDVKTPTQRPISAKEVIVEEVSGS